MSAPPVDPYRDPDAQPDPAPLVDALETRGRAPAYARLVRRFLRFAGVGPAQRVLEVGCGTGVVLRALAARVGPRGRVVGLDPSRTLLRAAARALNGQPWRARIQLRCGHGARLPFAADRFDVTLAVTVLLHVPDPASVVHEMVRVTRPGGRVAVLDQDFGTVALAHPDRALTERILDGVAARMYAEPWSGRRLPGLLRAAGLEDVRLEATVYQDTELNPYSRSFLERRAAHAVRFGLVGMTAARRWLDAVARVRSQGGFVLTMTFFGAVGRKRRSGLR
jgi:SAM-dependent methyltransferase